MNNDLISRSEVEKLGATCLARRNENGQLEAIISLDNAPTVEQPQGEWKERKLRNDIVVEYAFKCSKCKQDNGLYYRTNFCPNCGAKMKQD